MDRFTFAHVDSVRVSRWWYGRVEKLRMEQRYFSPLTFRQVYLSEEDPLVEESEELSASAASWVSIRTTIPPTFAHVVLSV